MARPIVEPTDEELRKFAEEAWTEYEPYGRTKPKEEEDRVEEEYRVEPEEPEATVLSGEMPLEEVEPEPAPKPAKPAEYKRVRALPEEEDETLLQRQQEYLDGLSDEGWTVNPDGTGGRLTPEAIEKRYADAAEGKLPSRAYAPGTGSSPLTTPMKKLVEYSGWMPPFATLRESDHTAMYRPATSLPYYGQRRGIGRLPAWALGREGFTGVKEGEEQAEKPEELEGIDAASARELITDAESKIIEVGKRAGFRDFEPLTITPAGIKWLRLDLERMGVPEEQSNSVPLEYVLPVWQRMRKQVAQGSQQLKELEEVETVELKGTARELGSKEEIEIEVEVPVGEEERLAQEEILAGKPSKSAKDALKNAGIREKDYDMFAPLGADIDSYGDQARFYQLTALDEPTGATKRTKQELSIPLVYIKGKGWNIDLNRTRMVLSQREFKELMRDSLQDLEESGLTPRAAYEAFTKNEELRTKLEERAIRHANKRIITFISERGARTTPARYTELSTPEHLADIFKSDARAPATPFTPILEPDQMKKFMGPWLTGTGLSIYGGAAAGDIYQGTTPQNISRGKLFELLRTAPTTVAGSWLTSWESPDSDNPQVIWESMWDHWGSKEHYEMMTTGQWDITERFYDVGDATAKLLEETPLIGEAISPDSYFWKKALGLGVGIPLLLVEPDPISVSFWGAGYALKPLTVGLKIGRNTKLLNLLEEVVASDKTVEEKVQAIRSAFWNVPLGKSRGEEVINVINTRAGGALGIDAADVVGALNETVKKTETKYTKAKERTQKALREGDTAKVNEAKKAEIEAEQEVLNTKQDAALQMKAIADQEVRIAEDIAAAAGNPKRGVKDYSDTQKLHQARQEAFADTLLQDAGSGKKRDLYNIEKDYLDAKRDATQNIERLLALEEKRTKKTLRQTVEETDLRTKRTDIDAGIKRQAKIVARLDRMAGVSDRATEIQAQLAKAEATLKADLTATPKKVKDLGTKGTPQEKWDRYLAQYPDNRVAVRIRQARAEIADLGKQLKAEAKKVTKKADRRIELEKARGALEALKAEKIAVDQRLLKVMEKRFKETPTFVDEAAEEVVEEVVEQTPMERILGATKAQKKVLEKQIREVLKDDKQIWRGEFDKIPNFEVKFGEDGVRVPYDTVNPRYATKPEGWRLLTEAELSKLDLPAPKAPKPKPKKSTRFKRYLASFTGDLKKAREVRLERLKKLGVSPSDPAIGKLMRAAQGVDDSTLELYRVRRKMEVKLAKEKQILAARAVKSAEAAQKANGKRLKKLGFKTPSEVQEKIINKKKAEMAAKEALATSRTIWDDSLRAYIDGLKNHNALLRRGGRVGLDRLQQFIRDMPLEIQAKIASLIGKGMKPTKAAEAVLEDIPKYVQWDEPLGLLQELGIERISEGPAWAEAGTGPLGRVLSDAAREDHPVGLPISREEFETVIKELKTGEEIAEYLAKNAEDPAYREIAARIAPYVKRVPVRVINKGVVINKSAAARTPGVFNGSARGEYTWFSNLGRDLRQDFPNIGFIHLRGADVADTGISANTVLHELIHAATVMRLDLALNSTGKDARDTALHQGYEQLRLLLAYVRAQRKKDYLKWREKPQFEKPPSIRGGPSMWMGYGAPKDGLNLYELVTYALVDSDFQDYLRAIPSNKIMRVRDSEGKLVAWTKDAFSYFVESVRKLLKLEGPKITTALGRLIDTTDRLLDAPITDPRLNALMRRREAAEPLSWYQKLLDEQPEDFLTAFDDALRAELKEAKDALRPPVAQGKMFPSEAPGTIKEGVEWINPKALREILNERYGKRIVDRFISTQEQAYKKAQDLPEGDPRFGLLDEGPPIHEILNSTEDALELLPDDLIRLQNFEDLLAPAANRFWQADKNLHLIAQMQQIKAQQSGTMTSFISWLFRGGAVANNEMSDELRRVVEATEHLATRGYEEVESLLKTALRENLSEEETISLFTRYMNGEAFTMGKEGTKMGETFMNSGVNLWDAVRVNLLNNVRWVARIGDKNSDMGNLGLRLKTQAQGNLKKKGVTQLSVRADLLAKEGVEATPAFEARAARAWGRLLTAEFKKLAGKQGGGLKKAFKDSAAIPKALRTLSTSWWPQGVQSSDKYKEILLEEAWVLINTAPDFPTFMRLLWDRMEEKPLFHTRTDKGIRAYHSAMLASLQAKIESQGIDRAIRIIGPHVSPEDAAAMNALVDGTWGATKRGLEAFDRVLGIINDLGLPINRQSTNEGLRKAAKESRRIVRIAEDPYGMNAFLPTDIIKGFEDVMGKIEKEIEGTLDRYLQDRLGDALDRVKARGILNIFLSLVRGWRASVVTGIGLANPRYWTNTSVSNFFQLHQEENIKTAAKLSFQSLPVNIPFVGRALQDYTALKAANGNDTGTMIGAVFNPHLQQFWNMSSKDAAKTYIRGAKGRIHNVQELRMRAAQDGILSTFESERGLLKATDVKALTGEEKLGAKANRKFADWNTAIAQMMVYGEQRTRTAMWLEKVINQGATYKEARTATLNTYYDWKHGISEFERTYLVQLMTFWRWWSLAARRHTGALTEQLTKPSSLAKVLTGRTKLGRIRKQLQIVRSLDEFSEWEDDTEANIDTVTEEWDALMSEVRPWWSFEKLVFGQKPMPLDHTMLLEDISGKMYTHWTYIGPSITSAEMHTYFLFMASGLSILAAQAINAGAHMTGREPPFIIPKGPLGGETTAGIEYLIKPLTDMLLPYYKPFVEQELGGFRQTWRTRPVSLGENYIIDNMGGRDFFNFFGVDINLDNNNRTRMDAWTLQMLRTLPFFGAQLPTIVQNVITAQPDMQDSMSRGMVTMLGNFLGIRKVPFNPSDQIKWEMVDIEKHLKAEEEGAKLPMDRTRHSDVWTE